ncbi:unnamed protein product [Owenia fusiformis]|uniref:Uncharacterized protein n=1 Tax=Owenia fusiformis TaxID=6347 RepID=A0A8J1XI67_OWEFU|nr:unnamed protein product [Owenia fusiformis]
MPRTEGSKEESKWRDICTIQPTIISHAKFLNRSSSTLIAKTIINSAIGYKESTCFEVKVSLPDLKNSDVDPDYANVTLLYRLTYESIQHHHPMVEKYTFAIPKLTCKGMTDCPLLTDWCYYGKDVCKGNTDTCVNKYFPNQKASGCFTTLSHDAELCTGLTVQPQSYKRYVAYYAGVPETFAHFKLQVFDANTEETIDKTRYFVVNLNQGVQSQADSMIRLDVQSAGPTQAIPIQMYFSELGSTEVLTKIPMNNLNEWDLDKLGWFKYQDNKFIFDRTKLFEAYGARITWAPSNEFTWWFDGKYVAYRDKDDVIGDADTVGNVYDFVDDAVAIDRHVIVTHRESPRMDIFLMLNELNDVLFHFDQSRMTDFRASIAQDKYSNKALVVTFYRTSGTVLGHIRDSSNQDSPIQTRLKFYVDSISVVSDVRKYHSIPSDIDYDCYVCLHPLSKPEREICKIARYRSTPLLKFTIPYNTKTKRTGKSDATESSATWNWLKYINPREWLNGIDEAAEVIVITFEIIIWVIILVIIIIIARCLCGLCKCISCCTRSKKTERSHPKYAKCRQVGELVEMWNTRAPVRMKHPSTRPKPTHAASKTSFGASPSSTHDLHV